MPSASPTTPSSDSTELDPTRSIQLEADIIDDQELARVAHGLDALDLPQEHRAPRWQTILRAAVPPLVAAVAFILLWQVLWSFAIWPEYQLPAPGKVLETLVGFVQDGTATEAIWTSVSRAILGFGLAIVIGVPIGLMIGMIKTVRAAIGPLMVGLQSLPSVAWVPAAILWFGITPATMFAVILLGSVPSIANGLVSGLDQIPTILPRVGKVLGARRLSMARHILLPAALPGFLGGLKQGWAFSWRSLMAAEIIASSPQLGRGLGQLLDQSRVLNSMSRVLTSIFLILFVGILVDLLFFRPLERRVLRARGLTGVNG